MYQVEKYIGKLSLKSFLGMLSLVIMLSLAFFILDFYFRQFFNIYSGIIIIFLIAFINGLIFEDSFKQSIILFCALVEFVSIFYFFISFAFNPWGTTTYIPPNSLVNIYVIFFATAFGSAFALIFVLFIGVLMNQFAVLGMALHSSNKN